MAKVQPNRYRYLTSLADELRVQANRVRDLIGDAHWLSDGHHKEYLLIELLRRHLPAGMIASRGFVVAPYESEPCSTEQDILVLDARLESPILNQGGLCIAMPQIVCAAISVKTTLNKESIRDSIKGLQSVRNVLRGNSDPRGVWCGAYYFTASASFEQNPGSLYAVIREVTDAVVVPPPLLPEDHPAPVGADFHCLARSLVFKSQPGYKTDDTDVVPPKLLGYQCGEIATAVFIGDILDHVAVRRGGAPAEFAFLAEAQGVAPIADPANAI